MSVCESSRAMRGAKPLGLAATILLCAAWFWPHPRWPTGINARRPVWTARRPCRRSDQTGAIGEDNDDTTPNVEPLS